VDAAVNPAAARVVERREAAADQAAAGRVVVAVNKVEDVAVRVAVADAAVAAIASLEHT